MNIEHIDTEIMKCEVVNSDLFHKIIFQENCFLTIFSRPKGTKIHDFGRPSSAEIYGFDSPSSKGIRYF